MWRHMPSTMKSLKLNPIVCPYWKDDISSAIMARGGFIAMLTLACTSWIALWYNGVRRENVMMRDTCFLISSRQWCHIPACTYTRASWWRTSAARRSSAFEGGGGTRRRKSRVIKWGGEKTECRSAYDIIDDIHRNHHCAETDNTNLSLYFTEQLMSPLAYHHWFHSHFCKLGGKQDWMNAALIFSISRNHPPNGQKRKGTEWATSWWHRGFTYRIVHWISRRFT